MLFSFCIKGVARRSILEDKQPRIYPEFTDRLLGGAARENIILRIFSYFSFFNVGLATRDDEEKLSIICVIIYGLT